jgi:hypothetical protein
MTGRLMSIGLLVSAFLILSAPPALADGWQQVVEFGQGGMIPDIAVDSRGDVYLFAGAGSVQVFDPKGEYLREFPVRADAHGIAIDENDEVYVLSNLRVVCYSTQGEFLRSWDSSLGQGDLGIGRGIDARGGVVCVCTVSSILRFSTDGVLLSQFQSGMWRSVYVLPDESIWAVHDVGLARHYSPDGHALAEWPTVLPDEPRSDPNGVAIDGDGRLFVGDNHGRVKIFLPSGVLDDLIQIPLRLVTAVALDGDDTLYVGLDFPSGVMKFVYRPLAVEGTTWGGIKAPFR